MNSLCFSLSRNLIFLSSFLPLLLSVGDQVLRPGQEKKKDEERIRMSCIPFQVKFEKKNLNTEHLDF